MVKKANTKKHSRRQISVTVTSETHEALKKIATIERRSISGQAEFFLSRVLSRNITGSNP